MAILFYILFRRTTQPAFGCGGKKKNGGVIDVGINASTRSIGKDEVSGHSEFGHAADGKCENETYRFFDVIYPKSDYEGKEGKRIPGRFIGQMKSEMHTDFVRVQIRKKKSPRFRRKTGQAVIVYRKRRIKRTTNREL